MTSLADEPLTVADCAGRTRLLILQPTPFCNLDCEYCYLPDRNDRHRMPYDTVEAAVRFVFEAELGAPDLTVVWHAGEPLVLPPAWYREALARVERASPAGTRLPHAMQTNAVLVDDAWCDFFLEHGIRLGVSLDGPAWLHDARRRTRSGQGTHARVMRGIETLQRRGVPFHLICVVGRSSLDAAEELVSFFSAHGLCEVGFNVEETEGVNTASSLNRAGIEERFHRFFAEVIERAERARPALRIREQMDLLGMLAHPAFGTLQENTDNQPFGYVTVSSRGAIFTFSPELAGLSDPTYGSLAVGQLPNDRLADVLAREGFRTMWRDIARGVEQCRRSCPYFDLCMGGAPANKLAEHGSFAAGETRHCKLIKQGVTDVVLASLEDRLLAFRPDTGPTVEDDARRACATSS